MAEVVNHPLKERLSAGEALSGGDDGSTSEGMASTNDIHGRLSRLEGGNTVLQWSVAVVSAVLLGGMAIVVGLQLATGNQIDDLTGKVDALPQQIQSNLLEVNRTLFEAITAARSAPQQAPVVIQMPESFIGTSSTETPGFGAPPQQ